MMCKRLITLCLVLAALNSNGQDDVNIVNFKQLTNVIAPSPNAASLGKFGEIPVSLHTGIPDISVPIYQWTAKRSNISINVGISYHAGGIKVEDIASNVGSGWALIAGGSISRSVRGLPDDDVFGFLNTPDIPDFNTGAYNGNVYHNSTTQSTETSTMNVNRNVIIGPFNTTGTEQTALKAIHESQLDGEQDIFYYSVQGLSGKFVLNKDGDVVKIDENNLVITPHYTFTSTSTGIKKAIVSFDIISSKGLKYVFDVTENSYTRSNSVTITYNYFIPPTTQNYTPVPPPNTYQSQSFSEQSFKSGFSLSKIIDPLANDTVFIDYNYHLIKYQSGFSEGAEYHHNDDPSTYTCQTAGRIRSSTSAYVYFKIGTPCVSGIRLSDGSTIRFYYGPARLDLQGDSAMNRIEITDLLGTVKQYQFNYDYTSGVYSSLGGSYAWTANETDYSSTPDHFTKRLRLLSIQQFKANGFDPVNYYQFQYNPIALPPRDSKAIDFWGYYIGPDRNSYTLLPKLFPGMNVPSSEGIMGGEQFSLASVHWEGTDRTPHPDYTKAGSLERITFPTGGTTSFEYETNSIASEVYYSGYEKTFDLTTIVHSNPGTSVPIVLDGRDAVGTDFFMELTRINANGSLYVPPVVDPNAPVSCFEDVVRNSTIYFTVKSTDNTVVKTTSFHGFDAGTAQWRAFWDLPLNKNYVVYYAYNTTADQCLDDVYFEARVVCRYKLSSNSTFVGGLRVKSITTDPKTTGIVEKTNFDYNVEGQSSGIIPLIPNYAYYLNSIGKWSGCTNSNNSISVFLGYADFKGRSSQTTQSLGYSFGANVGYAQVTKSKYAANESVGREVFKYSEPIIRNRRDYFPYQSIQMIDWESGHELEHAVYNSTGQQVMRTLNHYEDFLTENSDIKNRSVKIGCIRTDNCVGPNTISFNRYTASTYYPFSGLSRLIGKRVTEFKGSDSSYQLITYQYDAHYNLSKIRSVDSKGENNITQILYPGDFTTAGATALVAANAVSQQIVSRIFFQRGLPHEYYQTGGMGVDHLVRTDGTVKPHRFYKFNSDEPLALTENASVANAIPQSSKDLLESEITAYDDLGNITEILSKDGVPTSFIYGYKQTLPVAKIVGATYSASVSKLSSITISDLQNVTNATTLRTKLAEVRQGFAADPHVQVFTYTYLPLFGTTSETDPNGRTLFYEYDGYGRLILVRDKDGFIVRKICYGLSGMVSDCGDTFSTLACIAPDKKIINGICETATTVCTSQVRINGVWTTTYHYEWSDNSFSQDYTVTGIVCIYL